MGACAGGSASMTSQRHKEEAFVDIVLARQAYSVVLNQKVNWLVVDEL